jgi:hypothetical protein
MTQGGNNRNRGERNSARWRGWRCAGWLACGVLLALIRPAQAQEAEEAVVNREYPLKALFLYNFGSYAEWPPGAFSNDQAPFVIGVLGSAPINDTLNQIAAAKTIGGRKIAIEQFPSVDDIKPCQILFIARGVAAPQQRTAIEVMKTRPALIVGDSSDFAAEGGCVNFYVEANKIRFEINTTAVRQRQLKLSSKLLAMARIVDGAPADPAKR